MGGLFGSFGAWQVFFLVGVSEGFACWPGSLHRSIYLNANQPQFAFRVGAGRSRGAGPATGHPLRAAPSTSLRAHSGSGSLNTQGTHPCVSITCETKGWAGCFQLSYLFGALS